MSLFVALTLLQFRTGFATPSTLDGGSLLSNEQQMEYSLKFYDCAQKRPFTICHYRISPENLDSCVKEVVPADSELHIEQLKAIIQEFDSSTKEYDIYPLVRAETIDKVVRERGHTEFPEFPNDFLHEIIRSTGLKGSNVLRGICQLSMFRGRGRDSMMVAREAYLGFRYLSLAAATRDPLLMKSTVRSGYGKTGMFFFRYNYYQEEAVASGESRFHDHVILLLKLSCAKDDELCQFVVKTLSAFVRHVGAGGTEANFTEDEIKPEAAKLAATPTIQRPKAAASSQTSA